MCCSDSQQPRVYRVSRVKGCRAIEVNFPTQSAGQCCQDGSDATRHVSWLLMMHPRSLLHMPASPTNFVYPTLQTQSPCVTNMVHEAKPTLSRLGKTTAALTLLWLTQEAVPHRVSGKKAPPPGKPAAVKSKPMPAPPRRTQQDEGGTGDER